MKRFLAGLFSLIIISSPAVFASECAAEDASRLERLEKEVDGLKQENDSLKKRLDAVETDSEEAKHSFGYLSKFVQLSGYADVEYYFTNQENESDHFRVRDLSLFFRSDIQKEWKFFTEIEYQDAPLVESKHTTDEAAAVQGEIFVEQMYIEYHPSLLWDLRFGRFITPAGWWNIYHYPPYVPTQDIPLMVKRIFPAVSDGIQLRNSFTLKDFAVDTHLYLSNGAGNPGSIDRNEQKGFGARVNAERGPFIAGASYYRERDNSDVVRASYGLHLLLNYTPFRLLSEYQYRHNNADIGKDFNDKGFYAQLTYDIAKWTLAARYDWYDPDDTVENADMFRYTGAVNYHFARNVVGKAEYSRNDFRDGTRDFDQVILAIVVAIGDL